MDIINKFKIHDNGYWEDETSIGHRFDAKVNDSILSFIKKESIQSVADFGCGLADYAKNISKKGIIVDAFDGNPNTPQLTNGFGKILDLSNKINFKKNMIVLFL